MTQVWVRLAVAIEARKDEVAADRLSISRQASTAASRISGSHITPARPSVRPAPATITIGTKSWTTATPRLPPAAFSPRANPLSRSGKKKEMFVMLLAKLPPPAPAVAATRAIVQNGVSGRLTKYASPREGMSNNNADTMVQLRPPNFGTAKV